jgi:hypothetical protein
VAHTLCKDFADTGKGPAGGKGNERSGFGRPGGARGFLPGVEMSGGGLNDEKNYRIGKCFFLRGACK